MDSLRCEEILRSTILDSSKSFPSFCKALPDRVIRQDSRVFGNLLHLEAHYIPTDYSSIQNEIQLHMRKTVLDWMLEVCLDQNCHVDVFLLAVNILDRFLGTITIQKKQFQLLGASAIFLASKMIEPTHVGCETLVHYTADSYEKDELLAMELLILTQLKWDLTAVTAYDYLDHLLESFGLELGDEFESLKRHTERFISLCATENHFLSLAPSLVASASLASVLSISANSFKTSFKFTTSRLENLTNIEKKSLENCINLISVLFIKEEPPKDDSSINTSKEPKSSSTRDSDNKTPTDVFDVASLVAI